MIDYPNFLEKIFDKLKSKNAKAIIVGGYIRDTLLNFESNDIDIEVYNVKSFEKLQNILEEFGDLNIVGKSFGVCKLKMQSYDLDFTLPRLDSKIGSGHLGFDIKIDKDLDFKEAARRRDFTINAIGFDVHDKTLLDPFNGLEDLKEKTLKMVDIKTFTDDPLRVLRAVGFCSRYEFAMHEELFSLCFKMIRQDALQELPKERIYEEIKKILLRSTKPSIGFELLKELGALKYFKNLSLLTQDNWHLIMDALDRFTSKLTANIKTNEILMLAILCYRFDEVQTKEFVISLSDDKFLLKEILTLKTQFTQLLKLSCCEVNNYDIYKLASFVNIEHLCILGDVLSGVGKTIYLRAKELGVIEKKLEAIIMGKDLILLGLKPSIAFSKILDAGYEAQMREEFSNKEEALKWLNKNLPNYQ
ncbi:MAG: CCA tRNA nucleotidyltransferase [Sulfurimonas sp.]|uniref:CCA tRNA nucleotidyltransferase n=1 Tax=Sulfurimonas sp. TaxID=2022749 RepID=UPI0025CF3F1E|nr:CCA tRNA nucleotidyltransferase [Sulfurimonas sp.]MCK9491559.1 CCA tRNA nucleotidyltransferase [Sulfurimonas sp.]